MRLLILGFVLAASLSTMACGPSDKDKLDDSELAGAEGKAGEGPDTRCASTLTADEVKRQLFARAAEIRGSNADDYAQIAGFAVIDMAGAKPLVPVSAAELVDCRATVTLRLPAGLRVAGGRATIGGDVGYSIAPGARGMVTLDQSDDIAIPLATMTQSSSAPAPPGAEAPVPSPAPQVETAPPEPAPDSERADPAPEPTAPSEAIVTSRPSFDCRRARSASERAVCESPSLGALDRDMAAQYRSGIANAGPEERRLLAQTRDRFLAYRERCGSDACIANTYRGRMREIDDILAGRWQAPR